jgi:hypothetical protein
MMRVLGIIFALLCVAMPVNAGTPLSAAQADAFFKSCTGNSTSLPTFTKAQRDYLCACTASAMQKNLDVEDIQAMKNTTTTTGRDALAKMLTTVHFPCALRPIEDSVRQECMTRAGKNMAFAAAGATHCACLSKKMIDFVRTKGVAEAINKLQLTGQVGEPMDVLMNSSGYQNELIRNYYTCFNGALP